MKIRKAHPKSSFPATEGAVPLRSLVFAVIAVLTCISSDRSLGNPGRFDAGFVPTPPPNGTVRAILPLADGSVIIGGDFTGAGEVNQAYLAKYRENGSLDLTFRPVLNGSVHVISAIPFGGFFIGGGFSKVGETDSGAIGHMTNAGDLDLRYLAAGLGFNGTVHAIHGDLLNRPLIVGGSFSTYRGTTAKNLAGLQAFGALVQDFDVNGPVKAIAPFDNSSSTFVFGGSFTATGNHQSVNLGLANPSGAISSSGLPRFNSEVTGILALEGTPTNQSPASVMAFTAPPAFGAYRKINSSLTRITISTTGVTQVSAFCSDLEKQFVAGNSTGNLWRFDPLTVSGTSTAPWNASADFLPSSHTNGKIDSIIQESKFRYYIAGSFTTVDSQPAAYFARLLGPLGSNTPAAPVINRLTTADDRILIELNPVAYATGYGIETSGDGGITWVHAAELKSASITIKGFRAEEDYLVRVCSYNTNGTGEFGEPMPFRTAARRTSGAAVFTPLPGDWANGASKVSGLIVDSSGRLGIIGPNDFQGNLFGGFAILDQRLEPVFTFNATNNPKVSYAVADPRGGFFVKADLHPIRRLDAMGAADGSFSPGYDPSFNLRDMAVQQDGGVVIGGTFYVSDGAPNGALVRLSANGAVDSGFDPQFLNGSGSSEVDRIRPVSGDRLLIVGDFKSVDGVDLNDMVLLTAEGELDPLFRPDFETTRFWIFDDAAMDSQGRVLAAGLFANKGDEGRTGVARFLADGTPDPGWDPPVFRTVGGSIASTDLIAIQPDDKVLVAGTFSTVNGSRGCSVVRLNVDGTVDTTFDAGLGLRSMNGGLTLVKAMVLLPDSTIVIGGWFDTFDGDHREGFALLRGDGTLGDYNLWLAASQFPENHAMGIDTDHDGMCDGIEFAYSLNPRIADSQGILSATGKKVRITPPIRRGIEIGGLFSENLASWHVIPISPDWLVKAPDGMGGTDGFFRIEASPSQTSAGD